MVYPFFLFNITDSPGLASGDMSIDLELNSSSVTASNLLDEPPDDAAAGSSTRHVSLGFQAIITFAYLFGISANVCALVLLARGETIRNKKQTLMVRCLAWNDLVALLGSFMLMYMQLYMGKPLVNSRWFCALRVVLRTFGLSSGCVAVVMAVERWMALTRPFLYQKHVTYKLIKRAVFTLWIVALFLVCLPLTGFGVYYDVHPPNGTQHKCLRYRVATSPKDVAYAFLMFGFGCFLCVVIVCCNLAVVQVLCRMGRNSVAHCGRTTVRKDSKELSFNHTTPEELSFAKLMIVLCIFFVACWVPQMVTIVTSQARDSAERYSSTNTYYRLADICMAFNFVFDPVVYVLSRKPHRKGLRKLLKPICQFCWPHARHNASLRSTLEMSKATRGDNENSVSSSSHKDCIVHDLLKGGVQKGITRIIVSKNKPPDSEPPSVADEPSKAETENR